MGAAAKAGGAGASRVGVGVVGCATEECQHLTVSAKASAAMQAVSMGDFATDTPVASMSGGYQRRLSLAVQLARRPAALLLDEPLAGLDYRAREEVVATLAALKGVATLVVVSHDLEELSRVADGAWRLDEGQIEETRLPRG